MQFLGTLVCLAVLTHTEYSRNRFCLMENLELKIEKERRERLAKTTIEAFNTDHGIT